MLEWVKNAAFYHIYPLGFCGAEKINDFNSQPANRLNKVESWIGHMKYLGINALYLGPLFESTSHGYDTADYFNVDRRLGTNNDLKELISKMHSNGIRVILDGVFNHVGRDFPQFKDLQEKRESSQYINWFNNVNFSNKSPYNDPFSYEGWEGHYNLVKLNLLNPEVKKHLFDAIQMWINYLNIDGLRLDVAYCLDKTFLSELRMHTKALKNDFWLMGEMIHGDYNEWISDTMLDSGTNYECYKGLYSSHNDKNFFEIAYSLNRLFGKSGLYKDKLLYNFADNHDVDRAASILTTKEDLYTLYVMLFSIPGIPSIYYGSEFGIEGSKNNGDDSPLRPELEFIKQNQKHPALLEVIKRLIEIRNNSDALKTGSYQEIYKNHQQLAFKRSTENETIIVLINSSEESMELNLNLDITNGKLVDLLNNNEEFIITNNKLQIKLWPNWGRILRLQ